MIVHASKDTDLAARLVAASLLSGVLHQGQALDELMQKEPGLAKLEKRDRAFAHALTACCLRRLGQIDAALKQCLDRPQGLSEELMVLLRLGAAQILFLGTPSHAAVDTAVRIAADKPSMRPFKGLVNAVLRRLTREGKDMLSRQDEAKLTAPNWLWQAWEQAYGAARTREIALANLGEALTDISVKSDSEGWAKKLDATILPTGSLRLKGDKPIQELDGFAEGAWWVQDAAAALPVLLMGEVRGRRVMDLCAAPGGKTLQLAARGAHVSAVDRSEKRLERMRENLKRTGLEAAIFCADALTCKLARKAEIVLLDAPCTATGTLRRHPDVAHLKKPDDMARMCALQEKLLDHAATELVEPGGLLIYAVCSLQAEEAERQVERFLDRHPAFARKPVAAEEVGGAAALVTDSGDVRCLPCFWPEYGGMDGFYIARLTTKAG